MSQSYTIGRLAAASGVHVETIRYYQRRKLIPEPVRQRGGIRRYTSVDAERLRFIKRAKAMGFSLGEIERLLELRTGSGCHATQELAARKLAIIEQQIRLLSQLHEDLSDLVSCCETNPEDHACPVIERLCSRSRDSGQ